jgi:non-ribosomal peptide synthetase component F
LLAGNNQSFASLIHRAKALCDQDSLTQELEFLTTVFKDNGYSPQQIRAMELATRTAKTIDKPTSTAYIPYTQTTYGRLSRMLAKHNIKSVILPHKKSIQLPSTSQGCIGIKNTGYIQDPM